MKLLIVSERCSTFRVKLIDNLVRALLSQNVEVVLLVGEAFNGSVAQEIEVLSPPRFRELSKSMDEHRYLEIFKIAFEAEIDQVHFCFFLDPQRLYLALETDDLAKELKFSYSIFGIAEYLRKAIYRHFHEALLQQTYIKRVLIHSIHPETAQAKAKEMGILDSNKVAYVHDPLYDPPEALLIDKSMARRALALPLDAQIVLYFGTYGFKKGPDLLLSVAKRFKDEPRVQFIFAGNTSTATFDFDKGHYSWANIRFDDRFIDEETAYLYFAASDLVVQPYRRYYEFDTSGVLVQACLARRAVLVPDISPFKETVNAYNLGQTFKCEDADSLEEEILMILAQKEQPNQRHFEKYISQIESWSTLADLIL